MKARPVQEQFQRLRMDEPHQVQIAEGTEFRRQVDVYTGVVQEQARIDEVRLTGRPAGPKVREQATRADQTDAGRRNVDLLAIPVTEHPAGKVGVVQNRVESVRRGAPRIS